MRHITAEKLLDYLERLSTEAENSVIDAHLSRCATCAELKQELQFLVSELRKDADFEPPPESLQWAFDLFHPLRRSPPVGRRRLIAPLVFDSFNQPMYAGVRSIGVSARQLLYRAGDVDVDIKIESREANDRLTLAGQVLSSATKFFDNTPVRLESRGFNCYKTRTNVVGEFWFDEVPKDTYHLSVELPQGQMTLFCVHRGTS
jgi:hypothetical protein